MTCMIYKDRMYIMYCVLVILCNMTMYIYVIIFIDVELTYVTVYYVLFYYLLEMAACM